MVRMPVDLPRPPARNVRSGTHGYASTPRRNVLRQFLLRIQWIERGSAFSAGERVPCYVLGLIATSVLAIIYAVMLTRYLFALHAAFFTSAEDLGIIDQTLWNTTHGHFMRQTICNPIGDYNCLGIVSRFAIHFEPILAMLAPLYLIIPGVQTLMTFQVLAVVSGVIPAYLLAVRRLHHAAWGIAFALLYLLHPSLQAATISVFHPEALAAPILLWAFYCLATRRYRTLVALCVLALLCKETLALDVCMLGVYVAIIQRQRRLGVSLMLMSMATLALALVLMHIASPLGYSPVASRLTGLYHQPVQTIVTLLLDPQRRAYPVRLLAPVGFLSLLSPWMLAIAVPSFLLNVVSSDPLMFTGGYQYNTDIVPVLIAASIDGLVWALPAFRLLARRLSVRRGWSSRAHIPPVPVAPSAGRRVRSATAVGVVALALVLPFPVLGAQADVSQAWMAFFRPQSEWPAITSHDAIGDQLMRLVPANASVSAQSMLTPHLSERYRVYQFPSGVSDADYILLDVSRGVFYPYPASSDYVLAVDRLLHSCNVEIAAAQDGYLLLHRVNTQQSAGAVCEHPLPQAFYSFAYIASLPSGAHEAAATFAGSMQFIGYTLSTSRVRAGQTPLVVTTYWQASTPQTSPMTIVVTLSRNGRTLLVVADSWTQQWLPPAQWPLDRLVRMQTWPIYLGGLERGDLTIGVQVRYGMPDKQPSQFFATPVSIPDPVTMNQNSTPTLSGDGSTVQFASINVH